VRSWFKSNLIGITLGIRPICGINYLTLYGLLTDPSYTYFMQLTSQPSTGLRFTYGTL